MTDRRAHWETVYATKPATGVSWYQPSPTLSLSMIQAAAPDRGARIVDVGGGASTLVDHLLSDGYRHVTVVDIAGAGLDAARRRLGDAAAGVAWITADVTAWRPPAPFDVWHDRAVFHFLTEPDDRQGYREALAAGLAPGGGLVVSAFALDGPETCSGLPVRRYDAAMLAREFGDGFVLEDTRAEEHRTPAGRTQRFVCCRFRRIA